jgi:hypothetical protein
MLVLLSTLAFAAPAAASHETIPPNNSGANQYTENLPSAGGDQPTNDPVGGSEGGDDGSAGSGSDDAAGGAGGSGSSLPPGAEAAFDSLSAKGAAGAAAAALARAGAPATGDRVGGAQRAGSSEAGEIGGEGGGSFLEQLLQRLTSTDSDGMGILLPIILVLSVLAALLVALARRQGRAGRSA